MAITRSFAPVNVSTTNQVTVTYSNVTVGDLVIISTNLYTTGIHVTGITGGGVPASGAGSFQKAILLDDATNAVHLEVWWGIANATGSHTATVAYSASVSALFIDQCAVGFTAGLGSTTPWNVVASNTISNTTNPTWNYPSGSPDSRSLAVYWGWGIFNSTAAAGSTSGFTYNTSAQDGSVLCASNPSLSASTAYQPNGTGSPSDVSSALGVIFSAANPSTQNSNFFMLF